MDVRRLIRRSARPRLARTLIAAIISSLLVTSVADLHPIGIVTSDIPLEAFTTHLGQRISALRETYEVPGVSIALVKEGRIAWAEAFGYADLATGRRMTSDTYLRVQSISKPVTAWGVLRLVEQGDIDLDGYVQQYLGSALLPETEFHEEKVTIRQLLSHTAGMPLGDVLMIYSPLDEVPSLRENLRREATLTAEPGVAFSYSNVGYNLLELVVEEVTGRDFAEYMQAEVLTPLGLPNASFVWSDALQPPVPVGYGLTGQTVPVYVYPEKASGGLFGTARDIAAFVAAEMPRFSRVQGVLTEQSISMLHTPVVGLPGAHGLVFDSYGLGHFVETLENGQVAISHGGQGTGWMTHFHAVPATGDGIVILTNSQRSWPLISYVLNDWAAWRELPSVGMGRIVWGERALWGLICLVWAGLLTQGLKVCPALASRRRAFRPFSSKRRLWRLLHCCLAAVLIAGVIWCANQDYLFLSAVFPVVSDWLGFSAVAIAITMLVLALDPVVAE